MPEIGTFGSMSGDGRRTIGTASRHRAHPRLYCDPLRTPRPENMMQRSSVSHPVHAGQHFEQLICPSKNRKRIDLGASRHAAN
jgi:hypothetical protein